MSRLERHKQRREGELANSTTQINSDTTMKQTYDINPIAAKEKEGVAKRKRSYNNIVVSKNLDIEDIRKKAAGVKRELFDIEEAFKNMKNDNRSYDRDTQLEIMNDLFSENMIEYNDTIEILKDHHTKEITISEEDLIKMLDEKTIAKQKAIKASVKAKKATIKPANISSPEHKNIPKETIPVKELDSGNRPVVEVLADVSRKKVDHSMTQRINLNLENNTENETKTSKAKKAKKQIKNTKPKKVKKVKKSVSKPVNKPVNKTSQTKQSLSVNTLLGVVLIVLIIFLGVLVYQAFAG
ncbi:hypothetical protein [Mycoplasma sp. P36-A1]|uniref:hypothetical protein n=1 Tax=Mycoplasma sp. P36-A1 TaxID=3252900 RepID=UPI003C2ED47D